MMQATEFTSAVEQLPPSLRGRAAALLAEAGPALSGFAAAPGAPPGWSAVVPRVFASSEFVGQNCARYPDQLAELVESGDLFRPYARGELARRLQGRLAAAADDAGLKTLLRQVRRRELVRIAFRDLAGWADLVEVMATVSELADACIDGALARLHGWAVEKHGEPIGEQSGRPQRLVVLGLGKLGGEELNFSSDIDLIFAYDEDGETATAPSLARGPAEAQDARMPRRPGMAESGLDPIGETATAPSLARGPRLDPIGETATAPSLARGPRLDPIGETATGPSLARGPRLDPIGETGRPRTLSNHEFFVRLGQQLIGALSEPTADGFVFRVDMRLRPNGASGPLALSFDAMEHYYQTHGRDWERYALIKARVAGGDRAAGEELLQRLKPFMFRKYLDYSAIEAIRAMKVMIEREIARKSMEHNIKLGRGGIREIEFIAQALQLIRGGREPRLQDRRALAVLGELARRGYIEPPAQQELAAAYEFLRNVEHRLQMFNDEQTQLLPADDVGRERLAFAAGFASWPEFAARLEAHRQHVHRHFSSLFRQAGEPAAAEAADGLQAVWLGTIGEQAAARQLAELGYADVGEARALLTGLREGSSYAALSAEGRARLDRLVPLLLCAAARAPEPLTALGRLVRLIEAIGRRTTYLALLVENPPVLDRLVRLAGASPWIGNWISKHPILLDELIDPRSFGELPTPADLADELRQRLAHIPEEDLELQMEVLREFRHGHVLRVAAADIGAGLAAEHVGRQLAAIAEVVIGESLTLASRDLVRKHGRPGGAEPQFAVVGYGKLGSLELGYSSDLDIIFIYDAPPDSVTDGARSLTAEQFYARLGQRLIHVLTTRTPGGVLYEVDMRLRPSGKSGPLVASLPAFREYQQNQAWTWEHQALVRARAIAGSPGLRRAFEQVREQILCQPRDPQKLAAEVREMRQRMLETHGRREADIFDLKHDRGGIVDVEFMVQYAVLRWAHAHPVLARHTDNIHLLELLGREGLFSPAAVETLTEAYRRYLSIEHHLKLMERGAQVAAAELGDWPERVRRFWDELLEEKTGSTGLTG